MKRLSKKIRILLQLKTVLKFIDQSTNIPKRKTQKIVTPNVTDYDLLFGLNIKNLFDVN